MMNDNIEYYYERLQENILIVEDDEENKQALDAVTANFRGVYEYIKMFLIANKERYYGYFLMDMELRIDYCTMHRAGVTMDTTPFTLIVNPLLLGKHTIKEMIFIICHEIEHIVLEHPVEAARINANADSWERMALNFAMDASVNDRLRMEIKKNNLNIMACPNNAVTSEFLSDAFGISLHKLMDYLYYYNRIVDCKVEADGDGNPVELSLRENKQRYPKIITAKNCPKMIPLHKWTDLDLAEEVREQLRQHIQQVVDGIPDEMRGMFPSYQQEALNAALEKPRIRWNQMLRRYIGTVPNGYRSTRTRLNRRQPERYDISGRISRRTIDIIVAIDTSGSMSKALLEQIFTEIFTILKSQEFHLTIIECDADIHTVYEARTIDDVRLNVKGRGGTSFIPVIEYVNENKKFRKSVLIYFTDGMGDKQIPKPNVYRMLWVLPCSDRRGAGRLLREGESVLSVQEPYGDVIGLCAT